jgi:macrolide transport system ATP-binding/permease protein
MFRDLTYRLRALIHRKTVDSELDEELQYHLAREAEKYGRDEASPERQCGERSSHWAERNR